MDASKKRRIGGAAAVSATALASLMGAQPAAAREAGPPPGIVQACQSRPIGDDPSTLAFKQGFPIKWQGLRCTTTPDGGSPADWWIKIPT